MQKSKNIRLLVALLLMFAAIIFLQLSKINQSNLGVEKTIFQLHDQQEITDVYLKSAQIEKIPVIISNLLTYEVVGKLYEIGIK